MEEWRDIPTWEGVYQASSEGRVRALDRTVLGGRWGTVRRRGGILKAKVTQFGYFSVGLRYAGARKWYGVHRLVCLAFHGLPPEGPNCVAHFPDLYRLNNRPENLRWASHQENSDDRKIQGTLLYGEKNPSVKLTREVVAAIRSAYRRGSPGRPGNQKQLSELFGISPKYVRQLANGHGWEALAE